MPLRHLLRLLTNNEAIIQKLAESYPIRRAAQLTSFFFHKSKEIAYDTKEKLQDSEQMKQLKYGSKEAMNHAQNISSQVTRDIKQGFREISEEIKRKQQK